MNNDDRVLTTVRKPRSRRLFGWIKVFIIVYCLIGIAIYYLQDYFVLHPEVVPNSEKYTFTNPFEELNIYYDEHVNINLVKFSHTGSTFKGIILYFHGNRNNIKRYAGFVEPLSRHGYEVWMMDYPGFGKSTGKFSEELVYAWSLVAYNLARKQVAPDSIILFGKSLGSGFAAQLASVRDCKHLVLETPYYSMLSMADTYFWMYPTRWMIKYTIPTYRFLEKVTAPITIFHGTDDSVIPFSNAKRLQEKLKKGDAFITIPQGTHNNLNSHPLMRNKIDSLLSL
ncbi:alpha/beta fold hydrolase [Segetibacter sp. 3557_3]|uniref:alpha/beta hydrolase n=1 Tax=Segetibacter sp. 3557_3 TaxID=2547429 RepID=UPI001058C479|nr:alpha/beta fold hydrolase [Segetibacter sp. 3557_3]TDH23033.1 alpha/beta fold hydrolase [Segetibacter sp. 3557_3]